ncbi:MAG: glycoside hydrolase family 2 TIM barrel-domain containing protein [Bacteroidota bacterium]
MVGMAHMLQGLMRVKSGPIWIWTSLFLAVACHPADSSSNEDLPPSSLEESIPGGTYITKKGGESTLLRDKMPYPIKGACIVNPKQTPERYGGNAIRIYEPLGLDTLLDQANRKGLSVMVGLGMKPIRTGFDYYNEKKVLAQELALLDTVRKYRGHPALLMWNLGNEINLIARDKVVWKAVESLAAKIKAMDPHHPTTVSIHASELMVDQVAALCPSIDILSLNLFGAMTRFVKALNRGKLAWKKPYIMTEWGSRGYWETTETLWDAPIEPLPEEKVEQLTYSYHMMTDSAKRCLGGFVFLWGQKQERTHTWFSMFSEGGEKTPLIDAMQLHWTGTYPTHCAPVIQSLSVNGQFDMEGLYLHARDTFYADIQVEEGTQYHFEWELLPEGTYRTSFGGDGESRPVSIQNYILSQQEGHLEGIVPSKLGAYRLFVYVRDNQGGGSSANFPFFVITAD